MIRVYDVRLVCSMSILFIMKNTFLRNKLSYVYRWTFWSFIFQTTPYYFSHFAQRHSFSAGRLNWTLLIEFQVCPGCSPCLEKSSLSSTGLSQLWCVAGNTTPMSWQEAYYSDVSHSVGFVWKEMLSGTSVIFTVIYNTVLTKTFSKNNCRKQYN